MNFTKSLSSVLRYSNSAAVDSLIDKHLDLHRSGLGTTPTPTQMQAGVGYYGTTPQHTADFHKVLSVLAGKSSSASVSKDFFGAHPVGRRLQARLMSEGHLISPAGESVSVARKPVRYSKADGQAHDLVRGFRIEQALRHLTTDPAASEQTKLLAQAALYGHPENPHDYDTVTGAVHALGDSLQEDGHPLADEYNWLAASHKLHTDHAVGAAINAVAEHIDNPPRNYTPHDQAVYVLRDRLNGVESEHAQAEPVADEALTELRKHLDDEALRESLTRHTIRHDDNWVQNFGHATDKAEVKERAITPSKIPITNEPTKRLFRYARKSIRIPVHPILAGSRIALALKELGKHPDQETALLARSALRSGEVSALAGLNDRLQEIDHPMQNHYKWVDAIKGLGLDRETHKWLLRETRRRQAEEAGGPVEKPASEEEHNAFFDRYRRILEGHAYHAYTYGVPEYDTLRKHLNQKLGGGVSSMEVAKSLARLHQYHEDRHNRRQTDREGADLGGYWAQAAEREENRVKTKALSPVESTLEKEDPTNFFAELPRRRNFQEKATRFRRRLRDAVRYAKKQSKFSSTHILLDSDTTSKLKSLSDAIPDEDLGEDGREDDPHVTVKYGLHTDSPSPVSNLLSLVRRPIEYKLGKVTVFKGEDTGKDYDVVKVDVDSPDLHTLNSLLKTLPHTDTWPDYHPHATIAYVKAGLGEKYAKLFGELNVEGKADGVVFSNRDRQKTVIPVGNPKALYSKPGSDFISALRRVNSHNQSVLHTVAEAIQKKLKLEPAVNRNSIHDRPQASTANLIQLLNHDGDLDRVREAGAWYGLQSQSPGLLLFHTSDSGPDSLHRMTVTGSGERIRHHLDRHGLPQRNMVPQDQGFNVFIYSPDGNDDDKVQAATRSLGGLLKTVKGEGELLGGGDEAVGDEKSRRSFRSTITSIHRKREQEKLARASVQPPTAGGPGSGSYSYPGSVPVPTTAAGTNSPTVSV